MKQAFRYEIRVTADPEIEMDMEEITERAKEMNQVFEELVSRYGVANGLHSSSTGFEDKDDTISSCRSLIFDIMTSDPEAEEGITDAATILKNQRGTKIVTVSKSPVTFLDI